jgi:hypothetical protein
LPVTCEVCAVIADYIFGLASLSIALDAKFAEQAFASGNPANLLKAFAMDVFNASPNLS